MPERWEIPWLEGLAKIFGGGDDKEAAPPQDDGYEPGAYYWREPTAEEQPKAEPAVEWDEPQVPMTAKEIIGGILLLLLGLALICGLSEAGVI